MHAVLFLTFILVIVIVIIILFVVILMRRPQHLRGSLLKINALDVASTMVICEAFAPGGTRLLA